MKRFFMAILATLAISQVPAQASESQFNGSITGTDVNCRVSPGTDQPIQTIFQPGRVWLASTYQVLDNEPWYLEAHQDCWVNGRFVEIDCDGDRAGHMDFVLPASHSDIRRWGCEKRRNIYQDRIDSYVRESNSNPSGYSVPRSGRCDHPDQRDSLGRRCGRRARSSRR